MEDECFKLPASTSGHFPQTLKHFQMGSLKVSGTDKAALGARDRGRGGRRCISKNGQELQVEMLNEQAGMDWESLYHPS